MTDARIYSPSDPLPPGKVPNRWKASGRVAGMQPAGMVWRVAEAAHGFPVPTYLREDYPTEPVGSTPEPVTPDNSNWYYSADRLTGKVKGQISASGKVPGLAKGIWYEVGQQVDGRWAYSRDEADVPKATELDPVEPIKPPVVTPPNDDVLYGRNGKGELFLQNDALTVGLNVYGGIGTLHPAPDGFRTDVLTGLKRVGLFDGDQNDIVLQGRAIEGFALLLNGQRLANMQLTGLAQIKGEFQPPKLWVGKIGGVEIAQHLRIEGNRVSFEVVVTNNGPSTIPAGSYMRAIDPDQSDRYNSVNKVTAPGCVECTLDGGGKVTLSTDHAGAYVAVQAYNKAGDIGTTRAVGQSKTADEVVQLVMPFGPIAPGKAATFAFSYFVGNLA